MQFPSLVSSRAPLNDLQTSNEVGLSLEYSDVMEEGAGKMPRIIPILSD